MTGTQSRTAGALAVAVFVSVLVVVGIAALGGTVVAQEESGTTTIHVDDDWSQNSSGDVVDDGYVIGDNATATITDALDNASSDDTIVVHAGEYEETFQIQTQNVTLSGEEGAEIHAPDDTDEDRIVDIRAPDVEISGFTVFGVGQEWNSSQDFDPVGIFVGGEPAENANVSDNTIQNVLTGIQTNSPYGNGAILEGNEIESASFGISIQSNDTVLRDNTISGVEGGIGFLPENIGIVMENNDVSTESGVGHSGVPSEVNGVSGNEYEVATAILRNNSEIGDVEIDDGLRRYDRSIENVNSSQYHSSVQQAAGNASAGDVVEVGPGTYEEQVSITTDGLTIRGAGDGSNAASNTVINGSGLGGANTGITVDADNVTIQGLNVTSWNVGIQLNTIEDFTLDSASVSANANNGLDIPTPSDVDGLTITDSHFDHNQFGIYMSQSSTPNEDGNVDAKSMVTNVVIEDTTLEGNLEKGIYTTKLNNTKLDNLTVVRSGTDPQGPYNNGIDINLKYDDYSNITVANSTFKNAGLLGTEPDISGALVIKARDDGSYSPVPANLSDVEVRNNNFTASDTNATVALRFGEPGADNFGPTGVTVANNDFEGYDRLVWDTTTDSGLDVSGVPDNNDVPASEVSTDTTVFESEQTALETGVAVYRDGNIQSVHESIQAGVDAAESGDTVEVASGTYVENVTITTDDLTLQGAGASETTIEGEVFVPSEAEGLPVGSVEGLEMSGFRVVYPGGENTDDINEPALDIQTGGVGDAPQQNLTFTDNEFVAPGTGFAVFHGGNTENVEYSDNTFTVYGNNTATKLVFVGGERSYGEARSSSKVNFTDNVFHGRIVEVDEGNAAALEHEATGSTIVGNNFDEVSTNWAVQTGNPSVTAVVTPNTDLVAATFGDGTTLGTNDGVPVLAETAAANVIQPVVDFAGNGETVEVGPGTYTEQVYVDENVTLVGAGESETTIESPATLSESFNSTDDNYPVVFVENADADVRQLTVDGANQGDDNKRFYGVAYANSSGTVSNVTVENVTDSPFSGGQHGIAVAAYNLDGEERTFTLRDSTLVDYQKNGFVGSGDGLTARAIGNNVTGAGPTDVIGQNGIQISESAVGVIEDNDVSGHIYTGDQPAAATNVILYEYSSAEDTVVADNTLADSNISVAVLDSSAAEITGNEFENSTYHILDYTESLDAATLFDDNTFLDGAVYNANESDTAGSIVYGEIQTAVDAAESGDTVHVSSGTYDEDVTVNKNITVSGPNATLDGRVDVTSDGVTIEGVTITNASRSSGTHNEVDGILVSIDSDTEERITIMDVTIEDIGPQGSSDALEGIHLFGNNPTDGVLIENVNVRNVSQPDSGASAIKVQADVSNVTIEDSSIQDVSGSWSYGVVTTPSNSADGVPTNVVVENTEFENLTALDWDGVAVGVDESSETVAFADETAVHNSSFVDVDVGVLNKDPGNVTDARHNFWGENDGPSGVAPGSGVAVSENVTYRPWLEADGTINDDPVTFHVNPDTGNDTNNGSAPAPFETIDAALDRAQAGDVIDLAAETYEGRIVVDKDVTIVGEGTDATTVYANSSHVAGNHRPAMAVHADATIQNLSVVREVTSLSSDGHTKALGISRESDGASTDAFIRNVNVTLTDSTGNDTYGNALWVSNANALGGVNYKVNATLANVAVTNDGIGVNPDNDFGGAAVAAYAVQENVNLRLEDSTLYGSERGLYTAAQSGDVVGTGQNNVFRNNVVHVNDSANAVDIDGALALNTFDQAVTVRDADGNLIEPAIYTSIQDAVDSASPGEQVLVESGTYDEFVDISTDNVALVGEPGATIAPSNETIANPGSRPWLIDMRNHANVSIDGLAFEGNSTDSLVAVAVNGEDATVRDTTIENVLTGIQTHSKWDLANSTFGESSSDGAVIQSNDIQNVEFGISIQSNDAFVVNNTVSDAHSGIAVLNGRDNVQIVENQFSDLNETAVGISDAFEKNGSVVTSGSVEVHENDLTGGTDGVNNTAGVDVNAAFNYWGAADGPSGEADGSGVAVSDNVTFAPYYTDAALTTVETPGSTISTGFTVSDTTPLTNDVVDIDVTVENTGEFEADRTITLIVDDNNVSTQDVQLASGETATLTFQHRFSSAGEHIVTVDDGNLTLSPTTVIADRASNPNAEVNITSPSNGDVFGSDQVTVEYDLSNVDTGIDHATVSVNGGSTQMVPLGQSSTTVNLSEGANTITVSLVNNVGGVATSDSVTVNLDTTAPVVSIDPARDSAIGENNPVEIDLSVDDANYEAAEVLFVPSDAPNPYYEEDLSDELADREETITWDGTANDGSALPSGEYVLLVRARDQAGNVNRTTVPVSVDNDAPTVTEPVVNDTALGSGDTVEVTVDPTDDETSVDDVTVTLVADDVNFRTSADAVNNSGTWTATFDASELAIDGDYTVNATAMDAANNDATDSNQSALTVDTTAPDVSAILDTKNDTHGYVNVTVPDDVSGASDIGLDLENDSGSSVTLTETLADGDDDGTYSGTFAFGDGGQFNLDSNATDDAGNLGEASASSNFSVLEEAETHTVTAGNGTQIELNLSSSSAGIAALTTSDSPLAELGAANVGSTFLNGELNESLNASLNNATIRIPVDGNEIAGIPNDEVNISRYNETTESWDQLPTDNVTIDGTEYFVTTVDHFSTYGPVEQDSTDPTIENVSPVDGTQYDYSTSTVDVTVEYNDNNAVDASNVTVYYDGSNVTTDGDTSISTSEATFTANDDLAGSGQHWVNVTVVDTNGNTQTENVSFTVEQDTTEPMVNLVQSSFDYGTDPVPLEFTYSGGLSGIDTSSVQFEVNGQDQTGPAVVTSSGVEYDASGLASNQTHTATLNVSDGDGNWNNDTYTFELGADTMGPTVTDVSFSPTLDDGALPAGTQQATVTIEYDDAASGVDAGNVSVEYDGSDVTGAAVITDSQLEYTATGLTNGSTHTLDADIPDEEGNVQDRSVTIEVATPTVDDGDDDTDDSGSAPPVVGGGDDGDTDDGAPTDGVTGELTDGAAALALEGDVSEVAVQFDGPASGTVSAQALDQRPADVPAIPDGDGVAFVDVTVPDEHADDSATLQFTVNADALGDASADDVVVYHYADGEWTALDTSVVDESGGELVVEATTPGFSVFGVAVQDTTQETTEDTTDETTDDTTEDGTDDDTETTTDDADDETTAPTETTTREQGGFSTLTLGALVVLLAAMLGLFLLARRRA